MAASATPTSNPFSDTIEPEVRVSSKGRLCKASRKLRESAKANANPNFSSVVANISAPKTEEEEENKKEEEQAETKIVPVIAPTPLKSSSVKKRGRAGTSSSPTVGVYTVQCENCLKWRTVPDKKSYEKIRASFLQQPFVCTQASEWGRTVSCSDPADITIEDSGRMWAVDRPCIPCTPPGWDRLIHIRNTPENKFADVYYVSPCGKKLRSSVDVRNYLEANPDCLRNGVRLSQFDFKSPRPLNQCPNIRNTASK